MNANRTMPAGVLNISTASGGGEIDMRAGGLGKTLFVLQIGAAIVPLEVGRIVEEVLVG